MDFRVERRNGDHYLFAAEHRHNLHTEVFSPAFWQARGSLGAPLGGRGSAWRIREAGIDWVLRHYLRGGAVRRISRDAYLFTGVKRTRPWREFLMLNRLREQDLPVPAPVAAHVAHAGLTYRGSLITETLPGVSLAAILRAGEPAMSQWRAVGDCIRRLHDVGAWHADLNAHNILLDDDRAMVIDWDRGRFRQPATRWREANLARLQRSLRKVTADESAQWIAAGWQTLRSAYDLHEHQQGQSRSR